MPAPAEERIITSVVNQHRCDLALRGRSLLLQNLVGDARGDIEQLRHFEAIAQAERHKIPEGLARLERGAVVPLRINITEVIGLAVINVTPQRKSAIEKIRFRQRKDNVLPGVSVLDSRPEFLAGPGKIRPVHDIEISLRHFDKTNQLIDRAEAGAEVERAGSLFLHLDDEVLASVYTRIFRIRFDLRKITEVIQPLFGRLDPDAIHDVAGRDQDFPADHFVFGAGISDNGDALHEGGPALLDLIMDVDPALTRRDPLRDYLQVHVAAGSVGVRDFL